MLEWINEYNKTHNDEYLPYTILGKYFAIWNPGHRLANNNGYVYIHRLEAEKLLGRPLKKEECVHHKDENKLNNSLDNLMIFATIGDHTAFHNGCNVYCKNGIWYAESKPQYNLCPICNINYKYNRSKMCSSCAAKIRQQNLTSNNMIQYKRNSRKPSKEILERLINYYPMTYIGKLYGVSDKAVVKWCKSYNLPYYRNDIKSFRNNNNIPIPITPIYFL